MNSKEVSWYIIGTYERREQLWVVLISWKHQSIARRYLLTCHNGGGAVTEGVRVAGWRSCGNRVGGGVWRSYTRKPLCCSLVRVILLFTIFILLSFSFSCGLKLFKFSLLLFLFFSSSCFQRYGFYYYREISIHLYSPISHFLVFSPIFPFSFLYPF